MRPSRSAVLLSLLAVTVLAGGCEWFSTMSDTPSIQPHEARPLPPPVHSIPLDGLPDFDLANAEQVLTPPPAEARSMETGRAYYETFCAVCHGSGGLGNGPLTKRFPAIPAIVTPRVQGYTDAYIFAVISLGRGLMPEYGRIPSAARWDVVAYVRTLGEGTATPATGAAAESSGVGSAAGGSP